MAAGVLGGGAGSLPRPCSQSMSSAIDFSFPSNNSDSGCFAKLFFKRRGSIPIALIEVSSHCFFPVVGSVGRIYYFCWTFSIAVIAVELPDCSWMHCKSVLTLLSCSVLCCLPLLSQIVPNAAFSQRVELDPLWCGGRAYSSGWRKIGNVAHWCSSGDKI